MDIWEGQGAVIGRGGLEGGLEGVDGLREAGEAGGGLRAEVRVYGVEGEVCELRHAGQHPEESVHETAPGLEVQRGFCAERGVPEVDVEALRIALYVVAPLYRVQQLDCVRPILRTVDGDAFEDIWSEEGAEAAVAG